MSDYCHPRPKVYRTWKLTSEETLRDAYTAQVATGYTLTCQGWQRILGWMAANCWTEWEKAAQNHTEHILIHKAIRQVWGLDVH